MLGRFAGGYALGRIADRVGRKPVMVSGLISIATFSLTFGLSSSFSFAIGSRCEQQGVSTGRLLPEERVTGGGCRRSSMEFDGNIDADKQETKSIQYSYQPRHINICSGGYQGTKRNTCLMRYVMFRHFVVPYIRCDVQL